MPDVRTLAARLDEDEDTASAAADRLAAISGERPGDCLPVVDRLVAALPHDSRSVRTDVSDALFDVSLEHPESLVEHAEAMAAVLPDASRRTRVNLARSLAEVAFVDPTVGADVGDRLLAEFSDAHEQYRHSAAWAMEAIAPADPGLVGAVFDRERPRFDADYDPVVKHLARAMALVTRSGHPPDVVTTPTARSEVETALERRVDPDKRIGQAAALAVGAVGAAGSPRARKLLSARLRPPVDPSATPQDGAVRAGYRDAFGVTPVATGPVGLSDADLQAGTVSAGDWVGFTEGRIVPPGGALFGRVREVTTGAGDADPKLRLWNPLYQYRARVRPGRRRARYSDPWRSRDVRTRVSGPVRVDPVRTLLSLLAPGDTVGLELDGHGWATYHVEAVTGGSDRVATARATDGPHTVTVRPTTAPGKAILDDGLAFDVTGATLENAPDVGAVPPPDPCDGTPPC